jgi:hypothetical protein
MQTPQIKITVAILLGAVVAFCPWFITPGLEVPRKNTKHLNQNYVIADV